MDDLNKTKLTPSEVMKQWKVGRTKLYDMMSDGKLSYENTPTGKRQIDLSEAVRALGEPDSSKGATSPNQSALLIQAMQKQLESQERANEKLTEVLQDRIDSQQKQLDVMADVIRLLEHKQPLVPTIEVKADTPPEPKKQQAKRKGLFSRILSAAIE
jgi:hypothetical protein